MVTVIRVKDLENDDDNDSVYDFKKVNMIHIITSHINKDK